jgi:elongation factor Ts
VHVAAAKPEFLDTSSVDASTLDREKAIYRDQAIAGGKAPDIIEKMLIGRVRKYYEETVLLEQVYVVDGETRIKDVIANAAKELGVPVKLVAFRRYALGEGIEKKETDFAAEVAAQLKA